MTETTPTPLPLFSGDWEWHDAAGAYLFAFEYDPERSRRWNGWLAPVVSRRVMDAFAARQNLLASIEPECDYARYLVDGNGYMSIEREGTEDETVKHYVPDESGMFDLYGAGICFSSLDLDDNVCVAVRTPS